jgi:Tol biopolymer transport system component
MTLDKPRMTSAGKISYVRSGKLYTMNADGSGVTELMSSFEGTSAAFSPDGAYLMYAKSVNGITDLWAVASNGTGEKIRASNGDLGFFSANDIVWGR